MTDIRDAEDVDKALVEAASNGHLDVVKALLDPPDGRPAARADCRNGAAFVGAAFSGHAAVVLYLLGRPEGGAELANCIDGLALLLAVQLNRVGVVRELLPVTSAANISGILSLDLVFPVMEEALHGELVRRAAVTVQKVWRGRQARFEYVRLTSDPATTAGRRRALALWGELCES
jgi:hypothetical protein